MPETTQQTDKQFEQEVLRIARALWPSAEFAGAKIIDNRETDGVFETEDCIHIVEATTSRRMEKARQDIKKLLKLINKYQSGGNTRAVRGWFVTRDEPTADQRKITDKHRNAINALSFSHLQARLIDAKAYLNARDFYPFGSVRDPATGQTGLDIEYVPLDLIEKKSGSLFSRQEFQSVISEGRTVVLLGDYGAGKSMTLREVYRELRKDYFRGQTSKFPVYLNLRDHYGQTDTAEVFTRHSRTIGFEPPSHLVRAWRTGYVHLLIDGFDEVSTFSIQGLWHDLQNNRFRAMEAVRRLIREHPQGAGLLVAGREHFFDNATERHKALGLPSNTVELSLSEFNEQQIEIYLQRAGLSSSVPSWLPSRPLLVGYLAAKGLLNNILDKESISQPMGPAAGWDALLDSVTDREAEIEAGIDGNTVRRILERLATTARSSQSGSLTQESVIQAFRDICGYSPDDRGLVLLQRLPGLGVDREEENSRTFIDKAFADACKAGDLVAFVDDPFGFSPTVLDDIENSIGTLGLDVASWKIESKSYSEGKVNTALNLAHERKAKYMAADIARIISELGFNAKEQVRLDGILIPHFELSASGSDLSKLLFRDCFFTRVEIESNINANKTPSFQECFIDEIEGRVSETDLPAKTFDNKCHFNTFSRTAETTAEVLSLDLPLGTRVCLTVLKKLYERSGSGRKENALYRGLDHRARLLVPKVLKILQSEDFAFPDRSKKNTVWRPSRSNRERAGRMITAPTAGRDPILKQCNSLLD